MKSILAPSMMCCDYLNLAKQVKIFEKNQIDCLHIDVMDGSFVPNISLGSDFCKTLRKATDIPLDYHFMTFNPETTTGYFPIREGDFVSIHAESTNHLQRVLSNLKSKGARVLVALNPATPIFFTEDVLDDIFGVLVMTVNPGFAGQKMIEHGIKKIENLRRFLDENGRSDAVIEVDGNVSLENAVRMKRAGADMFVLGSSGIFCGDIEENIKILREKI